MQRNMYAMACSLAWQVRFFERVKIERQISQLKRQPQPADDEAAAEWSAQLAALQDDLVVG